MKNYIKFPMMLITGALMMSAVMAQDYKIVTVDIKGLLNDYYRKDIELVELNEERDRVGKINEERNNELRTMRDEMVELGKVANDPTASDDSRKEATTNYKVKYDKFLKIQQEYKAIAERHTRILNLDGDKVINELRKEIEEVVADYSVEKGYDFVFDKSGLDSNMVPSVFYNKDASDITAEVLVVLNKDAPK